MGQLYGDTPFKRHLSYLDRTGEGILRPYQTLRSALSIGLSFPGACLYTARIHWRFGNVGLWGLGGVDINAIPRQKEQFQLQHAPLRPQAPGASPELDLYSRPSLMKMSHSRNLLAKLRVLGFFWLASNHEGAVSRKDIELFQKGELLPELERRRKFSRENPVAFIHGGPLIVPAHSWLVDKLFDVQVYQKPSDEERSN